MGGVCPNSLAFVKGLWGATCNGVQLPENGTPFVAKIAAAIQPHLVQPQLGLGQGRR